MKLHIFSIYDSKADAFIQPFYAPTKAVGVRNFAHACNNPETDFYKFPGDYTLFRLGTFDPASGKVESETHENLGLALTFQSAEYFTGLRDSLAGPEDK